MANAANQQDSGGVTGNVDLAIDGSDLRQRVQALEAEIRSLRSANQRLAADLDHARVESRGFVSPGLVGDQQNAAAPAANGADAARRKATGSAPGHPLRDLQRQRDVLGTLISAAAQPMAIGFADGGLGIVNHAFEQLTGYTAEEIQSIGWLQITPPKWRQIELDLLAEQRKTRLPIRYEKEYVRKDGVVVPVELLVHLVTDVEGEADYYYSFVTDISHRKQIEESLRRSELRYRSLFETMSEGFALDEVIFDASGKPVDLRHLAVNPAFERQTGVKAEDFVGKTTLEIFPAAEPIWFEKLGHFAQTGQSVSFEEWFGEMHRCFEVRVFRTDVNQVATLFWDITDRKKSEQALKENEARTHLAVEATGVGIWEWNILTNISRWDVQMFKIYGVPPSADMTISHELWRSLVLPEDLPEQERALQETIGRLGRGSREFRIRPVGQSDCRYIESVEAVRANAKGQAEWLVGTNVDITARKRAEMALRQSEERLRLSLESGSMGIFEVDLRTGAGIWNSVEFELLGLSPGSAPAGPDTFFQYVHPEDHPWLIRFWQAALVEGKFDAEFRVIRADGQVRWLVGRGTFFYGDVEAADGRRERQAVRFLGVNYDITESKQIQEALREEKERLELAQRATGVGIFDWNMVANTSEVSREWKRIYGIREDAPMPSHEDWRRCLHPDDRETAAAHALEAARSGKKYEHEFRVVWPDGSVHWVHSGGKTVFDAGGRPVRLLGTAVDITQRKLDEQALIQSQKQNERLAQLVRDASQPLAIAYPDGGIGLVNRAFEQLTGYTGEELRKIGRKPLTPPEYFEFENAKLSELGRTKQPVRYEKEYIRKDGTRVPIELLVQIVEASDFEPTYYYTFVTDITERKRSETALREREAELARAREAAETASAAKDQFLAVLSHELRTPLAPVRLAISNWERDADLLPKRFHDDLAMMRRNVDLECRLIDDMLDLNRIVRGKLDLQFAPVDLHEELRHALQNVAADAAAKRIAITFDAGAERSTVTGDAARLQQIFWNLLKNAVKFTPPGGSVFIRSFNEPAGKVAAGEQPAGEDSAGYVTVEVRDTGAGIESDAIHRIFQAFEQGGAHVTRQFGGLGLGLAISRALAELHGGALIARSEGKGRGATFVLQLKPSPAVEPAASHRRAGAAHSSAAAGAAARAPVRILLVEDHKDTAHIMTRLLRSFGHDVRSAGAVQDALAIAEWWPFDLIISDIGLPDGDGYQLMRQIVARRPALGIALTGYGMEEDVKQGQDAGFAAHLTKPINLEKLELTIQRVIAGAAK